MKRIAKYLGIAAILLLLLLAAGGWLVNRWLQSPAFRTAFEQELSRALRMPVKTTGLTFSMWSGLTVQGLAVTGADGSAFEAGRVSASHGFASLLRGKFTLNEVRIEQPRIHLIEDAAGKWQLPRGTPAQAPLATPAVAAQPAALTQQPPATPAAPIPQKTTKSPVTIARIILSGGTVEMVGKTRAPFATLTGLDVTLRDATGDNFSGSFAIQRAALHGWLALDKLTGLVTREGRTVQLRQITAASGGGTVNAEAAWTEGATGTVGLKFAAINVAQTAQDAGAKNPRVGGILSGEVKLAGLGGDKNALTGTGTLDLRGGNCREIELLRQIGEVLQIAAIASFEISDINITLGIARGQITISPADVSAPPLGVTLTGPVAFDGALNLSGILHAPAAFVERHALVAGQFSPPDSNNRRGVQFNITGTLQKPRQNLAERLTGTKDRKQQRIIAAGSILSALMDRKKPQPAQPAPVPQPPAAEQ